MRLPALFTVILLALPWGAHAQSAEPAGQRAVLVTGASTGIGRKVTEKLALQAAGRPIQLQGAR